MVDCIAQVALCGPRMRGRPKALTPEVRRIRLLEAAEAVFLEHGFGLATMDEVARRAGMSKKTVYQLFDTKQSLFAALIAHYTEQLVTPIRTDDGSRPPRAVLREFLRQLARFVLSPKQVAITRLIIAEAIRTPELAQSFKREAIDRGKGSIVGWFERQRQRGTLKIQDCEEAASLMCGFVISEPQLRMLYGQESPPTPEMIDHRVDRALEIFFLGTGA